MGAAKNRGSRDARISAATKKKVDAAGQFAFVWDDSDVGKRALDAFLREGPQQFRDTLMPSLPALQVSSPRYICFIGSVEHSGGTSFAAFNDIDLLDGVLPEMMQRVLAMDTLCGFSIAVSVERRSAIELRLAELQPVWDNGAYRFPPLLTELLEQERQSLVSSFYGGHVVSYRDVSFEAIPLRRMTEALSEVQEAWVTAGDTDTGRKVVTEPHVERFLDGSLHIALMLPETGFKELKFSANEWRPKNRNDAGAETGIPQALLKNEGIHGGKWVDDPLISNSATKAVAWASALQEALIEWSQTNPSGLRALIALNKSVYVLEVLTDDVLRGTVFSPTGTTCTFDFQQGEWRLPAMH